MVDEHPGARHRSVLEGPQQGLQSLSGNSTTASEDYGSTKTITGIKRTTATDVLELYKGGGGGSSRDVTSSRTGSTAGSSRSQATTSQLGFFAKEETNGPYRQFRQAMESSNRGSKASTSKPKTPASHAPSMQYTSAYSASTKSSKVTAPFKPHTFLEANGKGKGKETAIKCEGPTRRKVVPILHESSSEDEMRLDFPKPGSSVSRLERSKKESRGSKDDERKDNVDVCPYAAPEDGVHVPDFLFTPPAAEEASALPPAPVSRTPTSSQENKNGHLTKQSTAKNLKKADDEFPALPKFTKTRDSQAEKPSDQQNAKRKESRYVDDMDFGDPSPASTLSHSLTHSSTASLEEATSKAKIAPSPVKLTPKTQRLLRDAEMDEKTREPAPRYNIGRTPTASRGIKSGPSAARVTEDVNRPVKKPSQTEAPDMPDEVTEHTRRPSPVIRPRSDARKAKPAAKVVDSMAASSISRKQSERIPYTSSSSLKATGQLSMDRQPLGERTARSSSPSKEKKGSSIAANSKREERVTDLTTSSPEKPPAITLSSNRYTDVDEDNEDSLEVRISSTIRNPPSSGYGSSPRKPISSFRLQKQHGHSKDRGAPSPVFQSKSSKEDGTRAVQPSKGTTRPRAKPAAPVLPKAIQPMDLTHLESSAEASRTVSAGKSPRKRTVEVIVQSSPTSKRRTDMSGHNRQDKQSKRRSVDREINHRNERSESPPDQTQILWDRAAYRSSSESDRDAKMHESDDDSDGDVRLVNYRETVLCPFCDRALPSRPSKRFVDQLEKLCRRTDLQPRRSDLNPMALRLPPTDTALTCKRHRDESEIIPAGEAAGYPVASNVNWKRIIKRIKRKIIDDLTRIISGKTRSTFYENARKEWLKTGARRMNNVRNDFSTFYLELPGYYGQKGFEVIMHVLTTELVSKGVLTESLSEPLDMEVYLRRVLVPETAIRLIQADQDCSASDALKILEESRDYGAAVFGDMDGVNTYLQESQYERGQRHMEEEEEASQREDILSSQGPEAQAPRTGQALITKLRKLCEYHT